MCSERDKLIEIAISEKYEKYTRQIIDLMKAIPDKMSGDDSPLKDVWEEWAYQVQYEQSAFYNVYEEQIRTFCKSIVEELLPDELKLLWAGRNPLFNDDLEEIGSFLVEGQMKCDIEDELLRLVNDVAANEELDTDCLFG